MLKLWKPLEEELLEGLRLVPSAHNDFAVDILEEKDNVIVEVHCAGIDPDKIDVAVEHNHLRVSGTREERAETKEGHFYRKEIRRGFFERIVALPVPVDPTKTMAEAKHGLLRIVLPKLHTEKASKIKITKK